MKSGFAKKLSLLRRQRGISQKKAAKDLGISQALLSHYENGIREPKFDFVDRVCTYYGVQADYILGRRASDDVVIACDSDAAEQIAESAKKLTQFLAAIDSEAVSYASARYIQFMAELIMATVADPVSVQHPEYDAFARVLYAKFFNASLEETIKSDYVFPDRWKDEMREFFHKEQEIDQ